jgi:hypothetical protein
MCKRYFDGPRIFHWFVLYIVNLTISKNKTRTQKKTKQNKKKKQNKTKQKKKNIKKIFKKKGGGGVGGRGAPLALCRLIPPQKHCWNSGPFYRSFFGAAPSPSLLHPLLVSLVRPPQLGN